MFKSTGLFNRSLPAAAAAVGALMLLTGCGAASVNQAGAAGPAKSDCGTVNVALNA